jgi:hypothetical protein
MKTLAERQAAWEAKQAARRDREDRKFTRADAYWRGEDLIDDTVYIVEE